MPLSGKLIRKYSPWCEAHQASINTEPPTPWHGPDDSRRLSWRSVRLPGHVIWDAENHACTCLKHDFKVKLGFPNKYARIYIQIGFLL